MLNTTFFVQVLVYQVQRINHRSTDGTYDYCNHKCLMLHVSLSNRIIFLRLNEITSKVFKFNSMNVDAVHHQKHHGYMINILPKLKKIFEPNRRTRPNLYNQRTFLTGFQPNVGARSTGLKHDTTRYRLNVIKTLAFCGQSNFSGYFWAGSMTPTLLFIYSYQYLYSIVQDLAFLFFFF